MTARSPLRARLVEERDVQPAPRIAVLAPCYNEAVTIAKVVADFRAALPTADIYVYDNASTDDTSVRAQEAGALVRSELRKGKGNVVRRMFADVSADIYVLVDGDDTYDAGAAPQLIARLLERRLDMVIGLRRQTSQLAYRRGHVFGNWLLTSLVNWAFHARIADMLSGYRVMTRRFVKSFPALSTGFEIETDLTVHALEMGVAIEEMPILYRERPEGSVSKLNSIRDGVRIVHFVARLVREQRPIEFFTAGAATLLGAAAILGVPVIVEFLHTGLVPRQPTWLLAVSLGLLSFLSLACGLILDGVSVARREARRMAYLAFPEPWR
ncbi:MAG: glycosyltransferase [Proteobacteria bacterium]|nr:glycosyltransferase [Pseudomonadota bacterium]